MKMNEMGKNMRTNSDKESMRNGLDKIMKMGTLRHEEP